MGEIARVILDQGGTLLDYAIPPAAAARTQIGSRVRVPVKTRNVLATVVELPEVSAFEDLRTIESVIGDRPALNPHLLKLARWVADYYCCPLEIAFRSVLPQVVRKAEMTAKTQLFVRLARAVSEEERAKLRKRSPGQADVIEYVSTEEKAKAT